MNKLLQRDELKKLLKSGELVIDPLLDEENQLGNVAVDFRLGGDFLVSQISRDPVLDITDSEIHNSLHRSFRETRRLVGEYYIFYPNQLALCSTLEYIKMPPNGYASLTMRSSYSRLGLSLSTIVKPGYCGCFSLELVNTNHIPIKVRVGAKILQARFVLSEGMSEPSQSHIYSSKYFCQVRPMLSRASLDHELTRLEKMFKMRHTR